MGQQFHLVDEKKIRVKQKFHLVHEKKDQGGAKTSCSLNRHYRVIKVVKYTQKIVAKIYIHFSGVS